MRVISGKYKGRKLEGFTIEGTRPTMDRVKESMFAMIQNYILDSITLDLFAGSGALGIEALSNGAKVCYFVDHNKEAIRAIEKNTKGIENKMILKQDWFQALQFFKQEKIKFSLILLDPPYHDKVLEKVLKTIEEYDLLLPNGIILCEMQEEVNSHFTLIKSREYGDKKIMIWKH